jgi:hypothetical protein
MTEAMKVPDEPPLGTIVRLEPDDGRRWKRTSLNVPRGNNWELWNRRTDGGDDGYTHLGWFDILKVAAGNPSSPFGPSPRTVVVVADDLLPAGTVWRTGRHLRRTVYRQIGDAPADDDPFLGMFDSSDTAQMVCELVNRSSRKEPS